MNETVRNELLSKGDSKLADFAGKIVPKAGNMIGIRVPVLRDFAKKLAKEQGETALCGDDIYYEEKMLRGMVIGYLKTDIKRKMDLIKNFVPVIDNWAVCDSFCPTLKIKKNDLAVIWDFIQPYLNSDKEFYIRFGVIMLLDYYINDDYIDSTLEALKNVDTTAYYASMAAAWTMAECFIKYPDKTLPYITERVFDKATHNRTIQKLCDSYRVSAEDKEMLRKTKIY